MTVKNRNQCDECWRAICNIRAWHFQCRCTHPDLSYEFPWPVFLREHRIYIILNASTMALDGTRWSILFVDLIISWTMQFVISFPSSSLRRMTYSFRSIKLFSSFQNLKSKIFNTQHNFEFWWQADIDNNNN